MKVDYVDLARNDKSESNHVAGTKGSAKRDGI
jgi:hypothetical protein